MDNPYENVDWGSFTKYWKNRKPEYKKYDTLEKFADFILANPSKFNKISKQRSHFYKNLIERKGGMFKKNIITKTKEEFNELWNRQIRILEGLSDYILDKIEENRGLLQASQLYDDYKNAATEVLGQSSELIRQLNNLKRDVLETDGLTEENKRTIINKKLGKLKGLIGKISNVKSEYDNIWRSIAPRAIRTTTRDYDPAILLEDPNQTIEAIEYDESNWENSYPITVEPIQSSATNVPVTLISSQPLRSLPINRLIQTFQEQSVNGNNANQALINELTQIQNTMHASLSQDQRVNDALKKYGFGRPKKRMKITKKCEEMYGGQMTRDLYNYHRQIGGKMSVSQFQKFLTNSYSKTPEQKIDDFEYDPELSIDRAKVYHDPKTGQAVITHTGTDSATDWLNNLAIATNTYKYTTRYKNAKKAQEATERKYGKQNVSSLGHSQGARLAEKISSDKNKEILTLNKATNPFESYHHKNQTDVRSSGDIVSRLNPFNWGKNKEIIIPKQSNDIIKEHSPNVLNRINPEMIIGEGRKRRTNVNKKLRRLCNCCGAKCPYCR